MGLADQLRPAEDDEDFTYSCPNYGPETLGLGLFEPREDQPDTCRDCGKAKAEHHKEEVDNYRGGEGWVVVAVGERGKATYMAVDPGFGAMRWWIEECGLHDPDDCSDLCVPEDQGIWRGRFKAWTRTSHEGEHDMGFEELEPWTETTWPLPKEST